MIGQTISHFKILDKLGEGGMGVVYKAEDTKLGRTVALKFLPSNLTSDAKAKRRFLREARAASALDHPNICSIHSIEETSDGQLFICMACYDGKSLRDIIEDGPLDVERAVSIAADVARGLGKAHEKGVIHRDIKPANIIVSGDDTVKIVDFGLAKFAGQSGITRTGAVVGTAAYMSPEQITDGDVDQRTDLWALGVVMYQMLTGGLPFRGDHGPALTYSILNESPEDVSTRRPETPPDLRRIIERALAKDPPERYQSAAEVLTDLEAVTNTSRHSPGVDEDTPSVAVLPFVNMSPDPEDAYFAAGLAEELITALARLKGVRVAAKTSAFRFRGGDIDVRDIGRKLNVGAVLEGGVRRSGNRLRVTVQLIGAKDGFQIWSERFDREMEDIFAIQDEITAAVVDQLEVKLVHRDGEPLVKRYTDNLDAYSLYLEGHHHLFTLTPEGWRKSLECYEKAVALDPAFAPAYGSLAQIHQSRCFWGDGRPLDEMPRARAAAEKALELDERLQPAHAVMAVIHWLYDWDGDAAEREFKRAFELDPTEPLNHLNYSLFLSFLGNDRHDEAIAEATLARKLDPLSSLVGAWAAIAPAVAGRYDDSFELIRQATAIDPGHWQLYQHLCWTCLHAERIEEALDAAKRAVDLSGGASVALKQLAVAHYVAGNRADGDRNLNILVERAETGYIAPCFFVEIYLARGERDTSLSYIEKAVEQRDAWLFVLEINPKQTRPAGSDIDSILEPVRKRFRRTI